MHTKENRPPRLGRAAASKLCGISTETTRTGSEGKPELRRCQGCAAPEGSEQRIRRAPTSERFDTVTVDLQAVPLADFGPRLLCRRCRGWARKKARTLTAGYRTFAREGRA